MKISFTFTITLLFTLDILAQPGNNIPAVAETLYTATEKKITHKIGDRNFAIKIFQYGDSGNLVCINLHDNEGTSVEAAKSILKQRGGKLIKIENNKQRLIQFRLKGVLYSFDPNRMFSKIGIEQTLKEHRKFSPVCIPEVEKFAQQLLSLIPDSTQCVVALHNNTEEAFSIKSYLPGGNRQRDAKAVFADSLQDVDDIILTTDSLLFQKMADNRYNSIWQDNINAKKDGSLSIYFGDINRRYVNIETQHGKVAQYAEMLDKLLAILNEENKIKGEIPEDLH
ncbi:MAG: hypothetical protein WBC06_06970 [Chitinophagaceae bacterium]